MQNGKGISAFTLLVVACIFLPGLFLALLFFVVLIVIVCMVDSMVKKAVVSGAPPAIAPPVVELSDEKRNEIIDAALAEAQRQMAYVVCPDPIFRKTYFETVFTRLCERQGVDAAKVIWKRTKV